MTTKFYLRNPNSKKETPINFCLQYSGKRFVYSTKQSIIPSNWNSKKNKPISTVTGSMTLNALLDMIERAAKDAYRRGIIDGKQITNEYLRDSLDKELTLHDKNTPFYVALDEFIEVNTLIRQPNTIKKYKSLKKHLKGFERIKNRNITFDSINLKFYDAFISYLMNDLDHVNNTVSKYIKTLKTYMKWTMERDYHKNNQFQKFTAKEKPADITYLTYNQVMHLYNLQILDSSLSRVKDYFCLACFTGLRYSDISQIRNEYYKDGSLFIPIKKTKETIEVPVEPNPYIIKILEKYDFNIKVYSNAITNKKLKEIGKLAGFSDEVSLKKYKGSETIDITKPLSEHLTFHLARSTFITLSLEQGIRPEVLMEIVGHKDYKTMQRYIKITQTVKKSEMQKAWGNDDIEKTITEDKSEFKEGESRSFSDWVKSI